MCSSSMLSMSSISEVSVVEVHGVVNKVKVVHTSYCINVRLILMSCVVFWRLFLSLVYVSSHSKSVSLKSIPFVYFRTKLSLNSKMFLMLSLSSSFCLPFVCLWVILCFWSRHDEVRPCQCVFSRWHWVSLGLLIVSFLLCLFQVIGCHCVFFKSKARSTWFLFHSM